MSEIPFSIIVPTVFGCITYYSVGLRHEAEGFFVFLVILILIYNAFSGYSLIISASFSDKQVAVTLTPVLIVPFMLFAGFFVSSSNIPWYLKEFEYLSIIKYGYQSLMHNQFDYFMSSDRIGTDEAFYNCLQPPSTGLPDAECDCSAAGDISGEPLSDFPYGCVGCCDPLSQLAKQSLGSSMGCLFALYAGCYLVSWGILACLSKDYDS